ncbi:TIGR04376 family protein [Geminocystis sp. CENA526]|uniref:TIGR04376 family protein n=1 Tax=Geminocystis sp. CENA526 TaxID=1355871 RepID=UPI003D6FB2A7
MNFFEDFTKFLESRLDEFLQSNPQLNLTILAQELKQQKSDTIKLIFQGESDLKKIENDILNLGKEIQTWHNRIEKAQQAGRLDLAQEAQDRENSLLTQGAFLWRQMEEIKQKIAVNKELLSSIETKEKEVNLKIDQLKASQNYNNTYQAPSWNKSNYNDDLESKFQQWEIDQQLQELKKNL